MSYYVIGIGGSGAKCVEALTHLCAIGMLPAENLYCIFVDPDRANGSLARATVTLRQYQACHQLQLGDRQSLGIFKTNVSTGNPHVWSPFMDKEQPMLADFFGYNTLKAKNPRAALLFDVLYSDTEKKTSLEMGFRGHPSIGAAIMARTVNLGEAEPWETFRKKISADATAGQEAKIFLVGSIFGGTGASGFPTIARLIKNSIKKNEEQYAKIGGALLLPYFSFIPSYKKEEMRAAAENFLMNAQMALHYYHNRPKQQDIIYLLGESNPNQVRYSLGSSEQKNEAHFIELYAALAAVDFFTRKAPQGFSMIAREQNDHIEWNDVPDGNHGDTIKPRLARMARFAFAYLNVYVKTLKDIRAGGKSYRAPWYVDYFERNKEMGKAEVDTTLGQIKEYCESFLLWLAQMQTSSKRPELKLVNHTPFAEEVKTEDGSFARLLPQPREAEFSNLMLPTSAPKPNELSNIWERVSDMKVRDPHAVGVGKFFHALYKACE